MEIEGIEEVEYFDVMDKEMIMQVEVEDLSQQEYWIFPKVVSNLQTNLYFEKWRQATRMDRDYLAKQEQMENLVSHYMERIELTMMSQGMVEISNSNKVIGLAMLPQGSIAD